MKIIVDTNIWYDIGEGIIDLNTIKHLPLIPTFCAIDELARTENLKERGHIVQKAIRSMMEFRNNVNTVPPFLHIARLCCNLDINKYVPSPLDNPLLQLTQTIANLEGPIILEHNIQRFDELRRPHLSSLTRIAENFTKAFQGINKAEWLSQYSSVESSYKFTREVIERLGEFTYPDGQFISLRDLDFGYIELFHKTMNIFLRELIAGDKMRKNDLYDITNMAYVKPGSLYWTRDKVWIERMIKAGCENYLFEDFDSNWSIDKIKKLMS